MDEAPLKNLTSWVIANTLNKKMSGIEISMSSNDIYDLFINDKRSELKIAVVVGDLTYTNRPQFKKLIDRLSKNQDILSEDHVPIILICYDSDNGNMFFGNIVSWSYRYPIIHKSVTLRKLTPDSWTIFMDNVRIMSNDFRFVDIDKILVIRHLLIEINRVPRKAYGEIVYLRKPIGTETNSTIKIGNKPNEKDQISLRISDNEYPNDVLDDLILEAVKSSYPSTIRKSSVVSNMSCYEELDYLREMQTLPFEICIQPEDNLLTRDIWNMLHDVGLISLKLQIFMDKSWAKQFFLKEKGFAFLSFENWISNYGELLQLSQDTFLNVDSVSK